MKLSILSVAFLAIAALVKCRPMEGSESVAIENVAFPVVDVLIITEEEVPVLNKAQAIAPAPIAVLSPVNETSVISEGEVGYQSQKISAMLAEALMEEEKGFSAARNTVKTCSDEVAEACQAFFETDGDVCYNEVTGVHCKTHSGEYCSDDAVDLCYAFTDQKGLYCSNGGCYVLVPDGKR